MKMGSLNFTTERTTNTRRNSRKHVSPIIGTFIFVLVLVAAPPSVYAQTMPDTAKAVATDMPDSTELTAHIAGGVQPRAILPDAPIAKPTATVCPDGFRKPCALLGGQLYWPSSLKEHDRSWARAMSHPPIFVMASLLAASFVADYKTTRYCVDRGFGHEGNPLMGQSRAQELSVGLAATGVSIWGIGELKRQGDGSMAVFAAFGGIALHTYAAYHNAVACGS
jgi:hypothetical protein